MKSFQILSKSKIVGTRQQQRSLSFAPRKNVRIAHAAVGKEHEHLFRCGVDFVSFYQYVFLPLISISLA